MVTIDIVYLRSEPSKPLILKLPIVQDHSECVWSFLLFAFCWYPNASSRFHRCHSYQPENSTIVRGHFVHTRLLLQSHIYKCLHIVCRSRTRNGADSNWLELVLNLVMCANRRLSFTSGLTLASSIGQLKKDIYT